jgi:hypothetical protein
MKGSRFSDLFADYLGINYAGKKVRINFKRNLERMWDKKQRMSRRNKVVPGLSSQIISEYCRRPATHMTLDSYITEATRTLRGVNRRINWKEVGKRKGLKGRKLTLLKKISTSLDGKDMLTYALTEIMPGHNGQLNRDVMDFLLRNAGRQYVEAIPALNDDWSSFGPYQLTSFAVYDTGREKRGASIINQALPARQRIPGSVGRVRGSDHHKAAYLNTINNLADLIRGLTPRQYKALRDVGRHKKKDLLKFIATAHNNPRAAIRRIAQYWLDNGARSDYTVSCTGKYKRISRETDANYVALR